MSILDGFFSLGARINKIGSEPQEDVEGVISALLPELVLPKDDEELISLKNVWDKMWNSNKTDIEQIRKKNDEYWLGKHYSTDEYINNNRPLADNVLFEALETFLPIATRQRPEPLVEANNTEAGQHIADKVRKVLAYLADTLQIKLKIKKSVRFWALYRLGVVKLGWSAINNEIDVKPVRPQKLILDPDATITESGEYTGEFIGEYRSDTAANLTKRFPNQKKFIKNEVSGKMGTTISYIEWWTDDFVFWTLKETVLAKHKNPHWNYDTKKPSVDEFGVPTTADVKGVNHFAVPKKPYVFLSVFNLGLHPWDDTSLIEQNIALQDMINKRLRQIDKNTDNMNGGLAVSGTFFTKEEAANVANAVRNGGVIWVPQGDVGAAVQRISAQGLPQDTYATLNDYRNELKNIFGIRGSSPQGLAGEQTVRGKIMTRTQDESRIGGGISEYIEQFVDSIYNYMVQLMYVYYDEPHYASIIGKENAKEIVSIQSSDFNDGTQLLVSVKEGSLIPTDPLTRRNEAIDLWGAGAIDPIELFTRLDYPNPREAAKQLFLWKTQPQSFFQELQSGSVVSPQATPSMGLPQGQAGVPPSLMPQPDSQQMAASISQMQSDLSRVPIK